LNSRIGIYAGTFDPVHIGHITFALQAVERAGLDRLYFLPERRPRHKQTVEHFGHRVAMLRQAIRPYPKFDILELADVSFSVVQTLPKLRTLFHKDQLVFLFGSDAVTNLPTWRGAEVLLEHAELVIGCRERADPTEVRRMIDNWSVLPRSYEVFESYAPKVSSGKVRMALRHGQSMRGLLRSVKGYSNRNWLYVSLSRPAVIDKT
jgi:nicotinate-nucleotide adenylyltransferase